MLFRKFQIEGKGRCRRWERCSRWFWCRRRRWCNRRCRRSRCSRLRGWCFRRGDRRCRSGRNWRYGQSSRRHRHDHRVRGRSRRRTSRVGQSCRADWGMGKCRYRRARWTVAPAAPAADRNQRKCSQNPPPIYASQVSSLSFSIAPALAEKLAQCYLSLASRGMELAIILADLGRNRKDCRGANRNPMRTHAIPAPPHFHRSRLYAYY